MLLRLARHRPGSRDQAGARGARPKHVIKKAKIPILLVDTTIAVVALRYIAGGLSATVGDGEWVITSYLAANAVILPITGWLSAHLGRRNYFLSSIAIFTLSSLLCGFAGSLGQLILFRVMQGLAGGGLQPSSQGAARMAASLRSTRSVAKAVLPDRMGRIRLSALSAFYP